MPRLAEGGPSGSSDEASSGAALSGAALRDLRRIPGVGPKIAADLWRIGLRSARDLRGRDPDELYALLESAAGRHVDRCVLYVLRCAVYFAETPRPEPERLLWWNWKD